MNALVAYVNKLIGRSVYIKVRLPFFMGLIAGHIFDLISNLSRRKFPISAIRVRKFCANSVYESTVEATGFVPPVPIIEAIEKTINFEFIEDHKTKHIFYSE
jgi:hypothetical protein